MVSIELQNAINGYENFISAHGISEDVLNAYVQATKVALQTEKDREYGLKVSNRAKQIVNQFIFDKTGGTPWDLEKFSFEHKTYYDILNTYYDILLCEAQNKVVDSGFMYLERKREPKERFYMPRRKQFLKIGLTQALQGMIDDEYDILLMSLIPGAGKTTIEKFFLCLVIGWFPKDFNLFYSHSGDITRMFYDGTLDIVTNADDYSWKDIFPDLSVTRTDAKMEQFNVSKYKPFPSVQCTSVGSKNAGKVRASKFLLVDDMIGGIEEALNPNVLDKLWDKYAVDARQRKVQDTDGNNCKEIHIATRWSVNDVIGRIQRMYEGNKRVKVISVPDVDENGESNFDYEYSGFTKEFFADQQLLMDDISYRCLYKQDPIEREGLLYHEDDLRRYTTLPDREPDAILGVCDTKSKGVDYMVLPCFYQYDDDFYMVDCICDDSSDFGMQHERLSNLIVDHNMQQCEFESNAGGDRLAHEVSKIVDKKGGRCNITTKATETNKETRIIVNSDWIKRHCLFKMKDDYTPKSDYGRFMGQMLSYSTAGKNKNDDVPDCLANFALFISRKNRIRKTIIMEGLL